MISERRQGLKPICWCTEVLALGSLISHAIKQICNGRLHHNRSQPQGIQWPLSKILKYISSEAALKLTTQLKFHSELPPNGHRSLHSSYIHNDNPPSCCLLMVSIYPTLIWKACLPCLHKGSEPPLASLRLRWSSG